MAEKIAAEEGAPPTVAALSLAENTQGELNATEQRIDPWDVKAATDAEGNVLAFDYEAISKSVLNHRQRRILANPNLQKMEYKTYRPRTSRTVRESHWPQTAPLVATRTLLLTP
jgi:hypothetical protein